MENLELVIIGNKLHAVRRALIDAYHTSGVYGVKKWLTARYYVKFVDVQEDDNKHLNIKLVIRDDQGLYYGLDFELTAHELNDSVEGQ